MSVYVSIPFLNTKDKPPWKRVCYMISDTIEELLEFGYMLGLDEFDIIKLKGVDCFKLDAFQREQACDLNARMCSNDFFPKKLKEFK